MKNPKTMAWALCFIVILGIAAWFRTAGLELRPVHGDEANQAVKTGILFDSGVYAYDPNEHHGPTLYYFTLPVLWAGRVSSFMETTIVQYRMVPAFFGLLLIGLLWPLRGAMGTGAVLFAALFMAVSPAMTYYSRYYVQEMLLVCFTQMVISAGWLLVRNPRWMYAIILGAGLGLLHATKETSVLILFSMATSGVLMAVLVGRCDHKKIIYTAKSILVPRNVGYGVLIGVAALLVSFTFFSSFFTHLRGPLDSLLTYAHYISRTEGEGTAGLHEQPWHYYFSLLLFSHRQSGPYWSEALVLGAAALGIGTVFIAHIRRHVLAKEKPEPKMLFQLFLVFYAIVLSGLYAVIPYKTPWNLLAFYHGLLLLGGIGASAMVRAVRHRPVQVAVCLLWLGGAAHLAYQSYQANFVYPADPRNPYVYAHPSSALRRLVTRIEDIAALSEEKSDLHINVIRTDGDYWPLPWYLRKFTRVGWWHRLPENADASIILAAPELYESLQGRLKEHYLVEFQALRPGVLLHAYIRQDLWDKYMSKRR